MRNIQLKRKNKFWRGRTKFFVRCFVFKKIELENLLNILEFSHVQRCRIKLFRLRRRFQENRLGTYWKLSSVHVYSINFQTRFSWKRNHAESPLVVEHLVHLEWKFQRTMECNCARKKAKKKTRETGREKFSVAKRKDRRGGGVHRILWSQRFHHQRLRGLGWQIKGNWI